MSRFKFAGIVIAIVVLNIFLAYYISVNTLLQNRALPNTKVYGKDVSFKSYDQIYEDLNDLVYSQEDYEINVKIDNYQGKIKFSNLNIQPNPDSVVDFGKGSIDKTFEESLKAIDGQEVDNTLLVNTSAVLSILPFGIDNQNFVQLQNNTLVNCEQNKYNLIIDQESLSFTIISAIFNKKDINLKFNDFVTNIEELNYVRHCNNFATNKAKVENAINKINSNLAARYITKLQYVEQNGSYSLYMPAIDQENFVNELSDYIDKDLIEGNYEIYDNKVLLFSLPQRGESLNIAKTDNALTQWFKSPTEDLPIKIDYREPAVYSFGYPVFDFSKFIASGKTRIDLVRDGYANYVIPYALAGLVEVNNTILMPGEEFSFIQKIQPQDSGYTMSGRAIGAGICNSTTTIYRAALESGFPITDRSYHARNVASYSWGYPLNIVDAAYLTTPKIDLKFVNDFDYPILIRFSYYQDSAKEYQYHTIDIYSSSQAPDRKVELYNFRKWNVQSDAIFEGEFNRKVIEDGNVVREDSFYSRYY